MLTPVIAIITGTIVFSPTFVYVRTVANINSNTNVIMHDIIIPFSIFIKLLFCTIFLVSLISFTFNYPSSLLLYYLILFIHKIVFLE